MVHGACRQTGRQAAPVIRFPFALETVWTTQIGKTNIEEEPTFHTLGTDSRQGNTASNEILRTQSMQQVSLP